MSRRPDYADQIRFTVEYIDPDHAEALLATNQGNRSLKWRNIDAFARDIAAHQWQLNGESIIIATSGRLMNGQHRLHAVIKAGVGIWTAVVRDMPESAFATLDRGAKRTAGDVLAVGGREHANTQATAAGHLWRWENYPKERFAASMSPTVAEIETVLDRHPEVKNSVLFVIKNKTPGLYVGRAAALHALFAMKDRDDADDFFMSLSSGANLGEDHPILLLRQKVITAAAAKRKPPQGEQFAWVIKAWNAYRERRTVSAAALRWRSEGPQAEAFPEPV